MPRLREERTSTTTERAVGDHQEHGGSAGHTCGGMYDLSCEACNQQRDEREEAFVLANDPPKPWRAENNRAKQMALLSGLDCLPGQEDLFSDLDKRDP